MTYSWWINQVERLFAYGTADLLKRSDHTAASKSSKPPDQIRQSDARLLQLTSGAER